MFGKITKICRHSFNRKVHVIVFVHWFGDTQYYQASGLYSVNKYHFIKLCLSQPLVHAIHTLTPNQLWILNFQR